MTVTKKVLLKVLFLLSAVEGLAALAAFLSAPSDSDAAFLFGYSLSRLAAAGFAAALVFLFFYLVYKSWKDSGWLELLVTKLELFFQNNRGFAVSFGISGAGMLLFGWMIILYSDPLPSDMPQLTFILNRLAPLVAWAFLLCAQFFFLCGAYSTPDVPEGMENALEPKTSVLEEKPEHGWLQYLPYLIIFASFFFVALFGYITLSRITYPYELEWMESGSLVQAARVLAGEPLFTEPSIQYVPFIYTSLYLYISALFIKLFGFGFFAMRLVSLLAACGSASLIYLMVKSKTGKALPAVLSVGLFAAAFPYSGGWFDIARVDSLFLLLLLLAGWWIYRNRDATLFLAGVSLALAYFTKQTALAAILILTGYSLVTNLKRSYLIITPMLVLLVSGIFIENLQTQGWYKYYTIDLLQTHRVETNYLYHLLVEFLYKDLFSHLPILAFLIPAGILLFYWRQKSAKSWVPPGNYTIEVLACSLILLSWGSRMNAGNYLNVLMPAFAGIAILFGLAANEMLVFSASREKWGWLALVYALILIQFGLLVYNPSGHIPTARDKTAGDRLIQSLESYEGEIFIPFHTAYSLFAGKTPYAHKVALDEIFGNFGTGVPEYARKLDADFNQAFQQQRFDAILLDEGKMNFDPYYKCVNITWSSEEVFYPVTGAAVRPGLLCTPEQDPGG